MRTFLAFIASLFFALSSFAGYEIESQRGMTAIKYNGKLIGTVVTDKEDNKLYIKMIELLIEMVKKTENWRDSTIASVREFGTKEGWSEEFINNDKHLVEQEAFSKIEKIEAAISSIRRLLES